MIPIDIELENFKQHKYLLHTYKPGITGIFGENGAGKSNFVTMAEFFGLTGELPSGVEAGARSSLLSWGEKQGSVTFRFSHDGITYTIERQLKGKDATLICTRQDGTSVTVTGHTAVNAKLEALYGVPMSIVQEQCFVPQGKLDDCINMTHSQRMAYFQRLIPGLTRAETLRGIIQDGINKLPVYPDRTEELKKLRVDVLKYTAEIKDLKEKIDKWTDIGKSYKIEVDKGKDKHSLPSEATIKLRLTEIEERITTLQSKKIEIVPLDIVKEPLEETNTVMLLETDLIRKKPIYEKAKTKICPTCNRFYEFKDVNEPKRIIAEYEVSVKEISKLREDLAAKRICYRKYLKDTEVLQQAKIKLAEDTTMIKSLEEQLDLLKKTPYVTDACRKALLDLDQALSDVVGIINRYTTDHEIAKVNLQTAIKQLTVYEEEQHKNLKILKFKQILERSREILHRDNLPRVILMRLLGAINNSMALYLNKFHVVFTAHLNSDFDFVCTFPANGITDVSARETLSGGQKVALALAFHFAKSDILGASIPLLVLDEPTAYLNVMNKEALCKVFGEARKFAEAGWYVMVSTHETMLETAMSNIVRIGV